MGQYTKKGEIQFAYSTLEDISTGFSLPFENKSIIYLGAWYKFSQEKINNWKKVEFIGWNSSNQNILIKKENGYDVIYQEKISGNSKGYSGPIQFKEVPTELN